MRTITFTIIGLLAGSCAGYVFGYETSAKHWEDLGGLMLAVPGGIAGLVGGALLGSNADRQAQQASRARLQTFRNFGQSTRGG